MEKGTGAGAWVRPPSWVWSPQRHENPTGRRRPEGEFTFMNLGPVSSCTRVFPAPRPGAGIPLQGRSFVEQELRSKGSQPEASQEESKPSVPQGLSV